MTDWQEKPQGARVEIGKRRSDDKYPVKFIFTGRTITKILTWEAAMIQKARFAPTKEATE